MLRNLRASLITYLPVKPEAPKIMTSYVGGGEGFGVAIVKH